MDNKYSFEYFYADDAGKFQFVKIPLELIKDEKFSSLNDRARGAALS